MNDRKTTKYRLFGALACGGVVHRMSGEVLLDRVQSVEREDGSGKCWNVRGYLKDEQITVFVQTTD